MKACCKRAWRAHKLTEMTDIDIYPETLRSACHRYAVDGDIVSQPGVGRLRVALEAFLNENDIDFEDWMDFAGAALDE